MSKFTDLLSNARNKKHMTKKDVAKELGWTAMYYGRYENGFLLPTKNNIQLFADFIGVSADELSKIVEEDKQFRG